MNWAKSYIYAGSRLLSTIIKNGTSETTEYHHPDRLGTKLVTDTVANTAKAQATLPFGTEIPAETQAISNQRFTSYDRSGTTGLDYAVNRTYNSGQSRFTQVDPIGMASASPIDPQSLNMFGYVQNDPIGAVDPSGTNLQAPFGVTYYLDGFQVSASLALAGLAGGWAVPANRSYSGSLGYWRDFDDYSKKTIDGFPGTGTIFVPNRLTLNQALARSNYPAFKRAAPTPQPKGNLGVRRLAKGASDRMNANAGPRPKVPCLPGALQIGIHGTGVLNPIAFTGGVGIAVDGSGNVGLYDELGAGIGAGIRGAFGVNITGGNANQIRDLNGIFANGSVGIADGAAASVNTAFGRNRDGSRVVQTSGVTLGGGIGGSSSVTITNTRVHEFGNVWNALGLRGRSTTDGCN